jgi:hypothetical protein
LIVPSTNGCDIARLCRLFADASDLIRDMALLEPLRDTRTPAAILTQEGAD